MELWFAEEKWVIPLIYVGLWGGHEHGTAATRQSSVAFVFFQLERDFGRRLTCVLDAHRYAPRNGELERCLFHFTNFICRLATSKAMKGSRAPWPT
jgi:hypothetical protein